MFKRCVLAGLMCVVAGLAQANEKVTVVLDWYVNPDHASLLAAQQSGAFKEAGLDVSLVSPSDPSMPPKLVASHQADLAVSYQPQLYLYVDEGLPLVRVGTLIDQPLNTLTVLAKSPIKTMADLKGKKIGYSVSGFEEALLKQMLSKANLSLNDVELINVNFQLVGALLTHKVDAVVGGFRNFEATEMRQQGVEPRLFYVEDYGLPAYDELVLLADKKEAHTPKIKRFMQALKKGTAYLKAHPQEVWEQAIKDHPEMDNALNQQAWKDTVAYFPNDPITLNVKRYQDFAQFAKDYGLIKAVKPISDYAVDVGK